VNGQCGAKVNACAAGKLANKHTTTTEYQWDCQGLNGGTTATCSIPKPINGQCAAIANTCTIGSVYNAYSTKVFYLWSCSGLNNGRADKCIIYKKSATAR
jgi:hypothetical protein